MSPHCDLTLHRAAYQGFDDSVLSESLGCIFVSACYRLLQFCILCAELRVVGMSPCNGLWISVAGCAFVLRVTGLGTLFPAPVFPCKPVSAQQGVGCVCVCVGHHVSVLGHICSLLYSFVFEMVCAVHFCLH